MKRPLGALHALAAHAAFLRRSLTQKEARAVISVAFTCIALWARDEKVRIPHFGTFSVRTRKRRTVRNPQTKELMQLPATKVLHFRPAKAQRGLR